MPLRCTFHDLAQITAKKSFRYLGIDLVSGCSTTVSVAPRRVGAFVARASIVQRLPMVQRGAAVADAVAALWAEGGYALTQAQLMKLGH
eukprot:2628659-Pyramimonas_sp.AAC.1